MIIVWLIILTVFVAWCVWGVIENTQTLLTMLRMTNELNKLERENIEMQKELERWAIENEKRQEYIESQIPTGKWINEKDVGNGNRSVECSNCGAGDEQAWLQKVPYCWKCGTKMEVEE